MTDQIKSFFSSRPSLNKSKFSRECGMHAKTIDLALRGKQEIPKKHIEKVFEVMRHYGRKNN